MKKLISPQGWLWPVYVGTVLLLALRPEISMAATSTNAPSNDNQPGPGEFDVVGKAVLDLVQSRDAAALAKGLSASAEDWHALLTTNLSKADADQLEAYARGADNGRSRLQSAAKTVLDRADSLHLAFAGAGWRCEVVPPEQIGRIYWSQSRSEGLTAPYLQTLELRLLPPGDTNNRTAGDFKLALRGLEKFPAGWRADGIQWLGFPTNLVDSKTLQELALLAKVTDHLGFDGQDDPALLRMGDALVAFLQDRDTNAFQKNLLMDGEAMWNKLQKDGRTGIARQEVDEKMAEEDQEQIRDALAVLKLTDDAGVDFKAAQIRIESAAVERGNFAGSPDSLDNAFAAGYRLVLSVKMDGKAKSGAPLAGEYVLGVKSLMHNRGDWKISSGIRWEKLPAGVVDAETESALEFENYVAKHGTLPLQAAAPEVEFTALQDNKMMKLSDLRGRVVILDFWATWCGPCQQPMADLQKLRDAHGDWGDRVAIVPLSIDDALETARKHVNQRGWTNTMNVWAGEGGWQSKPAKTFRVTGVPTSYVIDQQGKIVWAGHPATADFGQLVEAALKH